MLTTQETTLTRDSIDRFRNSLFARGRSTNTVRAYTKDLFAFLTATSVEEDRPILRDEFEELAMSWMTMERSKVSPKTTGCRLTSLRAYARWAGWEGMLRDYKAPEPGRQPAHPLPEGIAGVHRLINVAPTPAQKALIALCGLCGCRISEALDVTIQSFDLEKMTLRIVGKGSKVRYIPISPDAWKVIQMAYLLSYGTHETLVGLKDRRARTIITQLGVNAGLRRHISSHDLRATFGTEVYYKTLDIRVVQELLGHSTAAVTERYIGVSNDKMREAVVL